MSDVGTRTPPRTRSVECSRCHGNGELYVSGQSINPYSGVLVDDPQQGNDIPDTPGGDLRCS